MSRPPIKSSFSRVRLDFEFFALRRSAETPALPSHMPFGQHGLKIAGTLGMPSASFPSANPVGVLAAAVTSAAVKIHGSSLLASFGSFAGLTHLSGGPQVLLILFRKGSS